MTRPARPASRRLHGTLPRACLLATAWCSAVALALCWVPAFDLLAYPFCFALCVAQAFCSIAVGAAAYAPHLRVRELLQRALWAVGAMLLPALLAISARALWVTNCNWLRGLQFFVALPCASACYGAGVGLAIAALTSWPSPTAQARAQATPSRAAAVRTLLLITASLLPLVAGMWRLYALPPIQLFSHLYGFFSGSLYGENIGLDGRFWAMRAATTARMAACVGVVAWARRKPGALPRAAAVACALLGCVAVDAYVGPALGYAVDRAQLQRVLPVQLEGEDVVLHLPRGVDPGLARALLADHAFHAARIRRRLQLQKPRTKVHSYVFASASDKAFWSGGRNTMVSKPWLGEIYLHGLDAPHPLAAHELVHALLGPAGRPPLGVPWRGPLLPNMGLIEGIAVALSPGLDGDGPELMEAAACLQKSGLQARLVAAMGGPTGPGAPPFWAQAPQRAYVEAGAFGQFLLAKLGPAAVLQIYRSGAWQTGAEASLPQLVQQFVDGLTAPAEGGRGCPRIVDALAKESIFARVCAHEIADLKAEAEAAGRQGEPARALTLQRRILGFVPTSSVEKAALINRLLATHAEGDLAEAEQRCGALQLDNVYVAARVAQQLAVAFARAGQPARAQREAARGLALGLETVEARALYVTQWAAGLGPAQRPAMLQLLAGDAGCAGCAGSGYNDAWSAATVLNSAPLRQDPTAQYLLGRQLFARRQDALASAVLGAAGAHPFVAVEAERLRMLCIARWRLGLATLDDVELQALQRAPMPPAYQRFARAQRARLAWEAEAP